MYVKAFEEKDLSEFYNNIINILKPNFTSVDL